MMLAIKRNQEEADTVKVNLLPVKIQYDGPVEAEEKYWRPEQREGTLAGTNAIAYVNMQARWQERGLLPRQRV